MHVYVIYVIICLYIRIYIYMWYIYIYEIYSMYIWYTYIYIWYIYHLNIYISYHLYIYISYHIYDIYTYIYIHIYIYTYISLYVYNNGWCACNICILSNIQQQFLRHGMWTFCLCASTSPPSTEIHCMWEPRCSRPPTGFAGGVALFQVT